MGGSTLLLQFAKTTSSLICLVIINQFLSMGSVSFCDLKMQHTNLRKIWDKVGKVGWICFFI